MTKSTITDKRVTSVIERLEHYACNLKWTNVRGAQDLLTAADGLRELQERRKADSEPVQNHIGSKNSLDAIVSFIKSKSNPTVKFYEEVSEQLFKDNCHGIHSHVIEYILKLGEELEGFRAEQAEMQPAPGATAESISFDEWSRKCALQITLCYPDFREKAKYIWDSARETQHVASALFDDLSIFEAAIEECKTCDSIDEHAWNHGVLVVMAKYESCRAAMLHAQFDDDGEPTDDERIMAIEGIINPISDCDTPVYPDAEKRIADAVELLKKAAPAMLAGKSGPDGPLAGRMKSPVIPDGYVMVPKEATLEMIKSGASAASNGMLIPGIYKAMLAAADCSIPMISDRWIPVSKRMPEIGDIVLTSMGGVVNVGETECSAANCLFFTSVISGRELPATYWMPLPAGPME